MGSGAQVDLAGNLARVRERIELACARAGRSSSSVLLLAVTKVFPAEAIHQGYGLGLREFGENYVQEFEGKAPEVAGLAGARFHLIGHLQGNKARKAAELFQTIQTIDSVKLARRLDEAGAALAGPIEGMVEVKLSQEEAKHGAAEGELAAVAEAVRACRNVRLAGLMTVPPWSENAEDSRPYFAKLRELGAGLGVMQLSMGMSGDLEVAIAEGSTCVRIGTALFGRRKKP